MRRGRWSAILVESGSNPTRVSHELRQFLQRRSGINLHRDGVGINSFDAANIDPVMPRIEPGLDEGKNPTVATEMMLRDPAAERIGAQCVIR